MKSLGFVFYIPLALTGLTSSMKEVIEETPCVTGFFLMAGIGFTRLCCTVCWLCFWGVIFLVYLAWAAVLFKDIGCGLEGCENCWTTFEECCGLVCWLTGATEGKLVCTYDTGVFWATVTWVFWCATWSPLCLCWWVGCCNTCEIWLGNTCCCATCTWLPSSDCLLLVYLPETGVLTLSG